MTTRQYHADGLDFARTVLEKVASGAAPTATELANASEHLRTAAQFLRSEQSAITALVGDTVEDMTT